MDRPSPGHEPVAHVEGIYIAAEAGAAMRRIESAVLVPGVGISGDRYATRSGYWSDPKWPDQELTLVEAELEDNLGVEPGQLRRNIVTRGVALHTLLGRRFTMGTAVVEGVRPCDPCMHLEDLVRAGLFQQLAGKGGIRARVVAEGRVGAGDGLYITSAPTGRD